MLDNRIVNKVVSALLNQNGGNSQPTKLYGTVVVSEGNKFVKLDGSDILTAIVEGTEVIDGDRVLVSIENHQAVVLSNITSPASARTATSYMDFREEGLVIGEIESFDGEPPQSIVIGSLGEGEQGVYLRVGDDVIAKFIGNGSGYSKVELGPFDEYTAILDANGLNVYQNYEGYDNYDSLLRLQSGYIEMLGQEGYGFESHGGGFTADGTYKTRLAISELGGYSFGDCISAAVYTNRGTEIYFTIPLPFVLVHSVSRITCTMVVRCGGQYLIQFQSTGGNAAEMDTSVTANKAYVYTGNGNVQKNVGFSVLNVSTAGINCRLKFTGESSISNGLNNNAAVAYLYDTRIWTSS